MYEPFEITTRTGLRIAGIRSNPQASPLILALHGWLDNAHSYLPLMDHLDDFSIIAVDLPGHGYSDHKPAGYVYHFIDTIEDVVSIADALGLETFSLMGHSMGAGIAPLVAATEPKRVDRLICIEGLGPLSASADKVIDSVQAHVKQLRRLPNKKFPVYRTVEEALMARLMAGDIAEPAARLIVERALRPYESGVTWNTDARLRIKSAHPFTEEQIEAFMSGVDCPTLVFRAKPGFPFSDQQWQNRKANLKHLEYHELDGNHHVHMDKPEAIAGAIRGFYAKS